MSLTKTRDALNGVDVRNRVTRLLRTEGIEAAYRALVHVCNDPKAPSPAKATAATAIFRAVGLFDSDDGKEKELHEMTAEELAATRRDVMRQLESLKEKGDQADDDSLFG